MGLSSDSANRGPASSVEAQAGCDQVTQQKASIERAANGSSPLESHAFEGSLAFGMQDVLDASAGMSECASLTVVRLQALQTT